VARGDVEGSAGALDKVTDLPGTQIEDEQAHRRTPGGAPSEEDAAAIGQAHRPCDPGLTPRRDRFVLALDDECVDGAAGGRRSKSNHAMPASPVLMSSASVNDGPPVTGIFLSRPSWMKASSLPSGEKTGI
jgi:hypothetical protein